jgi:hypothetical protein
LKIIDYAVGFVGSRNDASSWKETCLYKDHDKLLEPGEWCWGDSGYLMQEWLVIPYSHPAKLEDDNGCFNYRLSSVRIESEHAIGYLKGRFQSLRELRLQLNSEEDVVYSTLWIQACIILHCFCLDHELGNMQEDFYTEGKDFEKAQHKAQRQAQREARAAQEQGRRQHGRGNRDHELRRAEEVRTRLKECMFN